MNFICKLASAPTDEMEDLDATIIHKDVYEEDADEAGRQDYHSEVCGLIVFNGP